VVTCAVNFKFIEWFGAISLSPRYARLTTLPIALRTSRPANLIGLLLSKDGFEKGIFQVLLGICGKGVDIADILEDLQDFY
jgi:hypothetical protein